MFKVAKKFVTISLSPKAISNYEVDLMFEELIRRFVKSSDEIVDEHFIPRDIIRSTTSLVSTEDDETLT